MENIVIRRLLASTPLLEVQGGPPLVVLCTEGELMVIRGEGTLTLSFTPTFPLEGIILNTEGTLVINPSDTLRLNKHKVLYPLT